MLHIYVCTYAPKLLCTWIEYLVLRRLDIQNIYLISYINKRTCTNDMQFATNICKQQLDYAYWSYKYILYNCVAVLICEPPETSTQKQWPQKSPFNYLAHTNTFSDLTFTVQRLVCSDVTDKRTSRRKRSFVSFFLSLWFLLFLSALRSYMLFNFIII